MLACQFLQLLAVLLGVAFYTALERKVLGYVQTRKGPNKPGPLGILVPFADAVKLIRKEGCHPFLSNGSFVVVPLLCLFLPLALWGTYPRPYHVIDYKFGVLYFLCLSALSVYGILGAG